jgi:hypothetical protein
MSSGGYFMSAGVCELACEILRATKDGDDLAPPDLKLVELAVNGYLNEAGNAAFMELHRNATKRADYTVPWFLGIEHMTRDHQRYIYWKGVRIEHYDHDIWQQDGWRERMKACAEALAAHCLALEAQGITPTGQNVVS